MDKRTPQCCTCGSSQRTTEHMRIEQPPSQYRGTYYFQYRLTPCIWFHQVDACMQGRQENVICSFRLAFQLNHDTTVVCSVLHWNPYRNSSKRRVLATAVTLCTVVDPAGVWAASDTICANWSFTEVNCDGVSPADDNGVSLDTVECCTGLRAIDAKK
jgi:hypothetical protein